MYKEPDFVMTNFPNKVASSVTIASESADRDTNLENLEV